MRTRTLSVSIWLCALLLLSLIAQPLGAQPRNYPNSATIDAATAQVSLVANEPGIGASNAIPISLKAQLIRKTPDQPPFHVLPLSITTYAIQWLSGPTFSSSCSLADPTLLSCSLIPAGPNWAAGTIRMRVRLDSTDGYAASSFTTFTISVLTSSLQTALTTVPGKGPATTNAEPAYFTAQMVRPTSPLPSGETLPVQITAYSLTPVLGNYSAVCNTVPTTMLKCTFTPSSGNWALPPEGQITLRAQLTAWDGGTVNSLVTLPVSGPGYNLRIDQFCGATGCPANGNTNQEIITVLVSKTSALAAGVEPFHSISSVQLESAYPVPSAFTSSCTNLTTMVRCVLTPSGASWIGNTQILWRIRAVTTDGASLFQTGSFRVN